MKRFLRRPGPVAVLAAAFLVAAACSGGETSGDLGLIETPNPMGGKIGAKINEVAPNFRLSDTDGGTITLSDLRGKPVLLNFWATWCGPCRSEMPEMQSVYERLGGRLTILGVDLDETREEVLDFKEELGVTFPTVIDQGQTVFHHYSAFGLPATYVIDADGVIRNVKFGPFVSEDDIHKSLEKVGL